VDGVLVEEVLGNLLENAARYTPRGAPITIRGSVADGQVLVEVLDCGPGLEPGSEPRSSALCTRANRFRPGRARAWAWPAAPRSCACTPAGSAPRTGAMAAPVSGLRFQPARRRRCRRMRRSQRPGRPPASQPARRQKHPLVECSW